MLFAELRVFWILAGVGQAYGDKSSLVSPEGSAVYTSQTSEEVPAAGLGEPLDRSSNTSAVVGTGSTSTYTILERDLR
jgi:hypothetical protein